MASDNFLVSSGTASWDAAGNWSLGHVPASTDDVTVTGSPSAMLTVTIAATDPAYTIASLTEATTNSMAFGETIAVSGTLTVTGATNINTGVLSGGTNAVVTLGSVVLSNSAEITTNSTASGGLTIQSLGSASSSSGGTVIVSAGTASVGSMSGDVTLNISSAAATVGSTAGNSYFSLNSGRLNLQSQTASLGDYLLLGNSANTVDLQAIAYQPGETYSVTQKTSGIFNTYNIVLKSLTGQTLYTFQKVGGVGSPNAQTAPMVSVASDGAGGTLVTLACYLRGTLILTDGGEVAVEALSIGDNVVTASGAARRIKWIGRRSYARRFIAANPGVQPVCFRAGAMGGGLPRRDLLVSPEHAMFVDGVLVPAHCLLNGRSVHRVQGLEQVDYFHVELDSHDIILAEGAPSESFLDDDSRGMFHNVSEFSQLYPEAGGAGGFCAPRVEGGFQLEAIRARLAGQVAARMAA